MLESGEHDRAIERFRLLLSKSPNDPILRGRLGDAYREAGNPDRAFHHYDQAAKSLTAMGRDHLAAEYLERADRVAPAQPEILFRLARSYQRLGRDDDLIDTCTRLDASTEASGDRRREWALERLVEHQPHDSELALRRARFLTEARRFEAAAEAYRALLAQPGLRVDLREEVVHEVQPLAEQQVEFRLPMAERALQDEAFEEGLNWLTPLTEQKVVPIACLRLLIQCLEVTGPVERLQSTRLRLAEALTHAGQTPEAARTLEAVLQTRPTADTFESVALTFASMGRTKLASATWARLIQHHHESGNSGERERAILQLLRSAPNEPVGLQVAAAILEETGRTSEAEMIWNRIRALEMSNTNLPADEVTASPNPPPEASQSDERTPHNEALRRSTGNVYGRGLAFGGSAPPVRNSLSDTHEDALSGGPDGEA